jgi:hypothetical protein
VKSRFLSNVSFVPAPVGPTAPVKGAKPIPMIGTMQQSTTREQRKAHHRMKLEMKKAARNIRYDQLQKQGLAVKG